MSETGKRGKGIIWEYFTKLDDENKEAECKLCHNVYNFKTTSHNLKNHLRYKHSDIYMTIPQHETPERKAVKRNSGGTSVWEYFQPLDKEKKIASCNECKKTFSYKTTTHNLKTHIRRVHKELAAELEGGGTAGGEVYLEDGDDLATLRGTTLVRAHRRVDATSPDGRPFCFGRPRDMTTAQERDVLKDFIQVYHDNPCLWDMSSDLYRNKTLKHAAWGLLTETLRRLDPDANFFTTKKKVENLRSAFFRELKKVRASERRATDDGDIFVPHLWYFQLMSFLDTKERGPCRASDPLRLEIKVAPNTDEESVESAEFEAEPEKLRPKRKLPSLQRKAKRRELNETFAEPLEPKTNHFSIYVGEKLEQISPLQRNVAEKLIADVLFMAKAGNLSYESRIATRRCMCEDTLSPRKEGESQPTTLLKNLLVDGVKY